MKLQQLTNSESDKQSTLRSELTKKEMIVSELRKEIEVNALMFVIIVFMFKYMTGKNNPTCSFLGDESQN